MNNNKTILMIKNKHRHNSVRLSDNAVLMMERAVNKIPTKIINNKAAYYCKDAEIFKNLISVLHFHNPEFIVLGKFSDPDWYFVERSDE